MTIEIPHQHGDFAFRRKLLVDPSESGVHSAASVEELLRERELIRQVSVVKRLHEAFPDPDDFDLAMAKHNTKESLGSLRDHLTGIINRRGFERHARNMLNEAAVKGNGIALGVVDLDSFKKPQDRYGHAFGDDVLRLTARSLMLRTRKDDLCARFGGDEFVVMATGHEQGMQAMFDRLLSVVKTDISNGCMEKRGFDPQITASIGFTFLRSPYPQLYTLMMRNADAGLYEAKKAGRNRAIQMRF